MINEISKNIWKINFDSNLYLINFKEPFVIDTGPRAYHREVKEQLSKVVDLKKIKKVIFTHLHYDHSGNFDLFPNADFYASTEEIRAYSENPLFAVINPSIVARFKLKKIKFIPIKDFSEFKIISTPGHTKGSICIFYKNEKILFSGDTLFNNGIGRTDLPSSAPDEMDRSLETISKINYKLLAPGHDY